MWRKVAAFVFSVLLIGIVFFLMFVDVAGAQAENKYGIHITNKEDIPIAASLVNGENGAWGYVTVVIQSDDRVYDKWQPIFYDLMKYKLKPIVRIATKVDGNMWTRPASGDAQKWAEFLHSLYWPTKQRIVSIYNEPNHGREWGGETDPAGYARELERTIRLLKEKSPDFFVLNAGFDSATPQEPPRYFDQLRYMEEMEQAVPGIFGLLDGWASHAYPNPGFAGKVEDRGRATIRGYEWELDLLKSRFGVSKELSVFIKETGWPYRSEKQKSIRLDEAGAAENTVRAFREVWLPDNRVKAVTPFLIRYAGDDFAHFSWFVGDRPSKIYESVSQLPKPRGETDGRLLATIQNILIPSEIALKQEYQASLVVRNTGERVWDAKGIKLGADDPDGLIMRNNFAIPEGTMIYPGQSYTFRFALKTEDTTKNNSSFTLAMENGEIDFGEKLFVPVSIYRQPVITLIADPLPERTLENVTVGVANQYGLQEVFTDQKIPIENGTLGAISHQALIPEVETNIVIAAPRRDRVSLRVTLKEGENQIRFKLPEEKSVVTLIVERVAQVFRRPS